MNNLRRKSLSTCGSISVEESLEVKSFGQSEQACVILIDIAKFPSGGGGLLTPPQTISDSSPSFPHPCHLRTIELFICCQTFRHRLASNCSLNLQFSYSEKRRVSFHVFKSHLYFLLCDLVCVRCHVFFLE